MLIQCSPVRVFLAFRVGNCVNSDRIAEKFANNLCDSAVKSGYSIESIRSDRSLLSA